MLKMAIPDYKNKPGTRKWFVYLCFIMGIVLVAIYCYKWHQVNIQKKYLNSYLVETGTINLEMTDIKEINSVLLETPSYYFVYISYTQDENVYNFEKNLKPIIDNYDLRNNFYYINITDIKKENKNYREDLAKELSIDIDKIKKIPTILYFKNGNLVGQEITNIEDFKSLLKNEQDIEEK